MGGQKKEIFHSKISLFQSFGPSNYLPTGFFYQDRGAYFPLFADIHRGIVCWISLAGVEFVWIAWIFEKNEEKKIAIFISDWAKSKSDSAVYYLRQQHKLIYLMWVVRSGQI